MTAAATTNNGALANRGGPRRVRGRYVTVSFTALEAASLWTLADSAAISRDHAEACGLNPREIDAGYRALAKLGRARHEVPS